MTTNKTLCGTCWKEDRKRNEQSAYGIVGLGRIAAAYNSGLYCHKCESELTGIYYQHSSKAVKLFGKESTEKGGE